MIRGLATLIFLCNTSSANRNFGRAVLPTAYTCVGLFRIAAMKNHVHMKLAKILMVLIGLWPLDLSGINLKLYNAYFYVSFAYFIIFDLTMGANVFVIKGNFLQTASNLNVTIVYIIHIYKIAICRSTAIKKIIEEIGHRETLIFQSNDAKIKDIYNAHVKSAFIFTIFYVCVGSCSISLYFIKPLIKNFATHEGNVSDTTKYLILSSWLPFDSDKYYVAAYLIQFAGGLYGYAYIVYVGAFFFCILHFITGQIKILQHILKNLHTYIRQYSKERVLKSGDPQEIFVKLCIREHQYLISLVERLDESVKTFMLLEFITSSFQLSLVVYQILQTNPASVERLAVFFFLSTLSSQLFFFYWNANEIIIQSTEISQAVFECQWNLLDPKLQKMLILVMHRAQKPIGISIGPIYQVRLDFLIAIFKAIYSFVAVFQRNNRT